MFWFKFKKVRDLFKKASIVVFVALISFGLFLGYLNFKNKSEKKGRVLSAQTERLFSLEQVIPADKNASFLVDTEGIVSTAEEKKQESELIVNKGKIEAKIINSSGQEIVKPIVASQPQKGKDKFLVEAIHKNEFKPGRYTLDVNLKSGDQTKEIKQDFAWGVLAINLDQSSYKVGETVGIGIGVLDDSGKTLCDAKVWLKIIDPSGQATELSTENKTITISDTCANGNVTNIPDYQASYIPKQEGKYQIELKAETANGTRNLTESFEVLANPDFVIKRHDTSMRIVPTSIYTVNISVLANKDLSGGIKEKVPASFVISDISAGGEISDKNETTQTISWPANLKAGENIELSYKYDPPDISLELFLLGPIEIWQATLDGHKNIPESATESVSNQVKQITVFTEPHAWQIASDAFSCVAVATGNWNAGATWSGCGANGPVAGDTVIINAAYTVTLTANAAAAALTVSAGTLAIGTYDLAISGNSTVSGGTVTIGSTAATGWSTVDLTISSGSVICSGASKISIAGNYSNSGTFTASTSTVTMNAASGGKTLAGTMTGSSAFNNLTFDNAAGGWSSSADITVGGVFTIAAGTFDASDDTITLDSAAETPLVINGTFIPSSSTVIYTGKGNKNITATTYNNLELRAIDTIQPVQDGWEASGAGDSSFNGVYVEDGTFNGRIAYTNGSKYLYYSYSGNNEAYSWVMYASLTDLFDPSGTPNCYYDGLTLPGTWNPGYEMTDPPTVTAHYTYTYSAFTYTLASGTINVNGNFVNGDGSHHMTTTADTNDPTLNINGTFINNANATFIASRSGSFSVASDFTNSNTAVFEHSYGTLTLDGQGAQSITSNGDSFFNITVTNTSAEVSQADGATIEGTLTINSGAIYDINGQEINLFLLNNNGTFRLQNGETVNIASKDTDSGTVEYDGSGTYNTFKYGNTYWNLKISGSGSFTQDAALTVYAAMTLSNGTLSTGSNYGQTIGTNSTTNGSYSQTGGVFQGNASAITCYGSYSITGGTYIAGTSTLTLDATPGDLTLTGDGYTFHNVLFNSNSSASNRVATIASGTLNFSGYLYVAAANTKNMTLDASANNPTINIAGSLGYSGVGSGSEYLTMGSGIWTIGGDVNFTNGTVTAGTSTLTLNNASSGQTLTAASQSLNNLTITNTSASGVTFADSLTVTGTFTDVTASSKLTFHALSTYAFNAININGQASGTRIVMVSSDPSNPDPPSRQWYFNISQTSPSVSYVNVTDSDASGGNAIISINSINGGNNENWLFNTAPVNNSLTFINPYSSNVAVADDTTEWTFRALVTDDDGPTNINYVEIGFANSADNTTPYNSLRYRWTEATNTFSEVFDTQNAAVITSTSANSSYSGNQWTLDFKIKINNNFLAKDTDYDVELYSVDDGSLSDTDNYANIYRVQSLSISLGVDSGTLVFGNLMPGSVITGTTTTTVTTNYPNGYSLLVSDGVTGSDSALLHTDNTTRIADYAGTIDSPTLWSGTGLGICVYSATNKNAKWGTGTTEDSANNKYAGVPQNATEISSKTGSPTFSDQTAIGYKIVVPNTQKTGNYSGYITYTATGVLN